MSHKHDIIDGVPETESAEDTITITDTHVVNSEILMLALTANTGDVCVRTDLSKTFILRGTDPSLLSEWQEFTT